MGLVLPTASAKLGKLLPKVPAKKPIKNSKGN